MQLIKIMEKYTDHGWMISDTYNAIIKAFGTQFDQYSFREMAAFVGALGKAGLRQLDVIEAVVDELNKVGTKSEATGEEYATGVSFNKVIVPIFKSLVELDFVGKEGEKGNGVLYKVIDDALVKKIIPGEMGFAEQALRSSTDHAELLHIILKGRLDLESPELKDLAEKLVSAINADDQGIMDVASAQPLYKLLVIAKSPLETEFKPKNMLQLKGTFEREFKSVETRGMSQLYQNSKIIGALQALGYTDVAYRGAVYGYQPEFYSQ